MTYILLVLAGLIAGFIDSIAGGGGLITLPTLALALAPGAVAVGTNKIVGVVGAATALWVYSRKHQVHLRTGAAYIASITLGSMLGTRVMPLIPIEVFRWLLIGICPVILFLVRKQKTWIHTAEVQNKVPHRWGNITPSLILTGIVTGFYDGGFGPGGGTFMLLGLLFVGKLPLIPALVLSKLANTFSAGTALILYSRGGYVHWVQGSVVAGGMFAGAWCGSHLASRKAEKIVRPMLYVAVGILMVKLLWEAR